MSLGVTSQVLLLLLLLAILGQVILGMSFVLWLDWCTNRNVCPLGLKFISSTSNTVVCLAVLLLAPQPGVY